MARHLTAPIAIAALALFNVILPEPIVLDILGTGLASIGLSLICEAVV